MDKAIVFVSILVLRKFPEYLTYCTENDIKALVLDEHNHIIDNLLEEGVFSGNNNRDIASLHFYTSLQDAQDAVAIWNKDYNIIGLINFRDDFVKQAALIAAYLDLPSPGLIASSICSKKDLQRQYLSEFSPRSQSIHLRMLSDLPSQYPFVIKPIDSSSSRNVIQINDENSLSLIPKEMFGHIVLCEDYVRGCEYSVESIVSSGTILFCGITQKITNENESHYFAEMGHINPPINLTDKLKDDLLSVNKKIIEQLNFDSGICHAEYKITDEGAVVLMEVACRAPGDAIMDLYSLSFRSEFYKLLIYCLTNNDELHQLLSDFKEQKVIAAQFYINHPRGTLVDVCTSGFRRVWFYEDDRAGYEEYCVNKFKGQPYFYIYRNRGDLLDKITNSYDRSAAVVFTCTNSRDVYRMARSLRSAIRYKIC